MWRSPRISAWFVAVGAAVAACVLAATGAFSGGANHETTPSRRAEVAKIRAQLAAEPAQLTRAERAHIRAEARARERAARRAAERRLQALSHRGHGPRDRYGKAARIADRYIGTPYLWGGASPHGFDSSGLVKYVFGRLGVSLPHYAVSQYWYRHAAHPPRSGLERGDLVFFAGLGHVGIYIGHNQFIHAPHTGAVVRIESLTGRWVREYDGAARILR